MLGCRWGRWGPRSRGTLWPAENLHFMLCLPCRLCLTCINLQNMEVKNLSLATLPPLRHPYFLPLCCQIKCPCSLDRSHSFWARPSCTFHQKLTSSHAPSYLPDASHITVFLLVKMSFSSVEWVQYLLCLVL